VGIILHIIKLHGTRLYLVGKAALNPTKILMNFFQGTIVQIRILGGMSVERVSCIVKAEKLSGGHKLILNYEVKGKIDF